MTDYLTESTPADATEACFDKIREYYRVVQKGMSLIFAPKTRSVDEAYVA